MLSNIITKSFGFKNKMISAKVTMSVTLIYDR